MPNVKNQSFYCENNVYKRNEKTPPAIFLREDLCFDFLLLGVVFGFFFIIDYYKIDFAYLFVGHISEVKLDSARY